MKGMESVVLKECAFKCMLKEPPVRLGELVEAGKEMAGNFEQRIAEIQWGNASITDRQLVPVDSWRTAPFH